MSTWLSAWDHEGSTDASYSCPLWFQSSVSVPVTFQLSFEPWLSQKVQAYQDSWLSTQGSGIVLADMS